MNSQLMPILCYLAAGVAGALGQYFYKMGAAKMGEIPLLKNWPLFAGMFSFCIVMVFFVWGFRLGGRLGVVYPFYATTFIWGALIAYYWEGEPVTPMLLAGVALICVGVALVGGAASQS